MSGDRTLAGKWIEFSTAWADEVLAKTNTWAKPTTLPTSGTSISVAFDSAGNANVSFTAPDPPGAYGGRDLLIVGICDGVGRVAAVVQVQHP